MIRGEEVVRGSHRELGNECQFTTDAVEILSRYLFILLSDASAFPQPRGLSIGE